MRVRFVLFAAAAGFVLFGGCARELPVQADLILRGGKIWTADREGRIVEAVAVRGDRILAIGPTDRIDQLRGERTEVIELQGRFVTPGFIDNHVHMQMGGELLLGVKLKSAKSESEFGERLAEHARSLPEGAWIVGGAWDHDNWPGGKLPTADLIDKYVSDRPVFVTRYDGHMSVANSMALKLARISPATRNPKGGIIVRIPGSRVPAGVLKDAAQDLMYRVIPEHSDAELKRLLEAAIRHAAESGVTALHDMNVDPRALRLYQELEAEGNLTVRVNGMWNLMRWRELASLGIQKDFRNGEWLKIGGLKGFVDGSLGSSTALFFEPYLNDPRTRGIFVNDPANLRQAILQADSAGMHVVVHAIGDSANSWLLSTFAEAIAKNGPRDRRFRIEHAQHIAQKDFRRFADMGVIASVQPYHAIDDGRWAEGRIGHARCQTTYPFRAFLDAGVITTFGSDWTVAPLSPILGIDAAVTRRTTDGKNPDGWIPDQKITVEEALRAYTSTGAFASFDEDRIGSIQPGKLADFVVLSQDLLSIPSDEIVDTKVELTIAGGRVVYRADDTAAQKFTTK